MKHDLHAIQIQGCPYIKGKYVLLEYRTSDWYFQK